MKKLYILSAIAAGMILMNQCAAPKTTTSTTTETKTSSVISTALLDIAKKRWPNANVESLTAGHTIYNTKCNTCHGVKSITNRTEEQWMGAIKSMAPKAKLTAEETETLTQYLLSAREAK